jgi:hypothetical protein
MTVADLEKLRDIVVFAQERGSSATEVADVISSEVPAVAGLGALFKDAGMPLATWLAVIIAAVTLILQVRADHSSGVPPDQVDQIVQHVLEESRKERPPPPRDGPRPH